jgi:selenocysteine lyase/cysteine desulfurase
VLSHDFAPESTYLDTACYGLPPAAALSALSEVTAAWATGSYDPRSCDQAIERARAAFGRIVGLSAAEVAVGHQVSPMVGVVAASLPQGARVLTAEGDFTSLLFPFLATDCRLDTVPLADLPAAIDARTDVVAVSAVQSANGAVANLDEIAAAAAQHHALTLVDATQACGWLPLDAGRFDIFVCGAYKWLCNPRGTAFMTLSERAREELVPLAAGWYAGPDPWATCYGTPTTRGASTSHRRGSAGMRRPRASSCSRPSGSSTSTPTISPSPTACAPGSDCRRAAPPSSR